MQSSVVIFIKMKPLKFIFIGLVYWLVHLLASSTASTINPAMIDDEGLWTQNGTMYWSNACEFHTYDSVLTRYEDSASSIEECGSRCVNTLLKCNYFNYYQQRCELIWKTKLTRPERLNRGGTCGYIPSQIWKTSSKDERIVVSQSNCTFTSSPSADSRDVSTEKNFDFCRNRCLNDHRCSVFSYNDEDGKCILPNQAIEYEKQSGPLILLEDGFHSPVVSSSASAICAVVSTRIWQKYLDDDDNIFFYQDNCYFNEGVDIEEHYQNFIFAEFLRQKCMRLCSFNPNCTHFTYHENGTCFLKNAPLLTDRVETEGNISRSNGCGYISERAINFNLKITSHGPAFWQKNCEFALPRIGSNSSFQGISADDCLDKCFINSECNHFSHDGSDCYLMFEWELGRPRINLNGWTCGYIKERIWRKTTEDDRILQRFNCAFQSSSDIDGINENDVSNESIMTNSEGIELCMATCLADHRCNAFSVNWATGGNCVIPQKETKIETERWSLSSFSELFRLRNSSHENYIYMECYIIPTRNWKVDRIGELGDGVLYQNECDFDKIFDIENETKLQNSFNDCVTHCFNLSRCTHFSYSERNRICSVKKAAALTDRVKAGGDKKCGYIPSRWNLTDDETYNQNNGTINSK